MIIRSYLDADFDSIILLWERCHFGENGQDLEIDIERKIAHDPELFLVAELSGQVVGTLMGGYDGHCGSGYYLAVHPDFRGRGIANALITRLEKKLMARGCAKIYLRVNSQNYMLINMFEKLSYEEAKIFMMEKTLSLPLDFEN